MCLLEQVQQGAIYLEVAIVVALIPVSDSHVQGIIMVITVQYTVFLHLMATVIDRAEWFAILTTTAQALVAADAALSQLMVTVTAMAMWSAMLTTIVPAQDVEHTV